LKLQRGERFIDGARDSLPIAIGYLGVGFAAGVVERAAGLSDAEIVLLAALVYAGSMQFVVSSMLFIASPVSAILSAAFLVNARYLLLAASLAPLLRRLPPWKAALLGLQLTDQTYVVAMNRYSREPASSAAWLAGLQVCAWLAWTAANLAGAHVSAQAAGLEALAFALPSMFAALLVVMLAGHPRGRVALLVALGAAALALALQRVAAGPWAATLAAGASAAAALALERWKYARKSSR
jgi:4-azaleucine resistance transporter AzlC